MVKGKTYEIYYKNNLAFSINSGGKVVINNNTLHQTKKYNSIEELDDED